MKKKLLVLSLTAILAAPAAFAAYTLDATPTANTTTTDDPRDLQTVSVTVPEIALLDVNDTAVPISTPAAPANAGDGFAGVDAIGAGSGSSTFSLSSNGKADDTTARTIDVSVASGAVPLGATLKIVATGAGSASSASITTATTAAKNAVAGSAATGINNVKTSAGSISYKFGAISDGGMIAYTGNGTTSDDIGLVYTLSDD